MHNNQLKHVQNNWQRLAETDPYFSVVTDPVYKNGPNPDFWQSGEHVGHYIADHLTRTGFNVGEMTACELGCGVGRVMKGIAWRLKSVEGYDISPEMLKLCRSHAKDIALHQFTGRLPSASYDLVYSIIVLQHNPPAAICGLLETMFHAARKAVWVQLPLPTGFNDDAPKIPNIPMYGLPVHVVEEIGRANGFDMASCEDDECAGPGLPGKRYVFKRVESLSQAHQDLAALALFGKGGRFLDIGSGWPIHINNTYMLEMNGWSGVCIDAQKYDYSFRSATFLNLLAGMSIRNCLTGQFDYVSLDVDENTNQALRVLLDQRVPFLFATIEHDKYKAGEDRQREQEGMLTKAGYVRIFKDIHPARDSSVLFEDWWCHPDVCNRMLGECLPSDQALEKIKSLDRC